MKPIVIYLKTSRTRGKFVVDKVTNSTSPEVGATLTVAQVDGLISLPRHTVHIVRTR